MRTEVSQDQPGDLSCQRIKCRLVGYAPETSLNFLQGPDLEFWFRPNLSGFTLKVLRLCLNHHEARSGDLGEQPENWMKYAAGENQLDAVKRSLELGRLGQDLPGNTSPRALLDCPCGLRREKERTIRRPERLAWRRSKDGGVKLISSGFGRVQHHVDIRGE